MKPQDNHKVPHLNTRACASPATFSSGDPLTSVRLNEAGRPALRCSPDQRVEHPDIIHQGVVWECSAADRRVQQWVIDSALKTSNSSLPSEQDICVSRCRSRESSLWWTAPNLLTPPCSRLLSALLPLLNCSFNCSPSFHCRFIYGLSFFILHTAGPASTLTPH